MSRPRLLLIPQLTELEWLIRPALEEWAEVASFDTPGVGDEPPSELPLGSGAIAARGLKELDRRGWDSCVVVADEFAGASATRLIAERPRAVQGFAFGHARLSNDFDGERAPVNRTVFDGLLQILHQDYRTWVQQMTKLTKGSLLRGGYGEDLAREYMERVPPAIAEAWWKTRPETGHQIGEVLRSLDCPVLLACHEGCIMFTPEGFEDAVTALPAARAVSVEEKPSASEEFAEALRSFCRQIA